jgi:tetratricopeptide (TPR) repeat protein
VSSSPIDGNFYFAGTGAAANAAPAPNAPAPAIDRCAIASEHWKSAEAIGTQSAFEDHLARFSSCAFAGLARAHLDELQSKVAAVTPVEGGVPVAPARRSGPADSLRRDLVTECDRLAASPYDVGRPETIAGVGVLKIDIVPALAACNDAMRQYPDMARFVYQASRVSNAQKDYVRERELLEKASNSGYAPALNNLGVLYDQGHGVAPEYAEARRQFEKAATAGVSVAMRNLGSLYELGRGVPQDYATARSWYEKAADAGSTWSAASTSEPRSSSRPILHSVNGQASSAIRR